jgi:hypothetical protein
MMGYAIVMGHCFGCGSMFSFNPHRVPSIRDARGVKQPVCRECIELANPMRVKNGLEPIVPAPDAYEAINEEEL